MNDGANQVKTLSVRVRVDGVVISQLSGRAMWLDCAEHGAQPPAVWAFCFAGVARFDHATVAVTAPATVGAKWSGMCPECGALSPVRYIMLRKPGTGIKRKACGAHCLNGSKSCDCACRGRCHGAGECKCGVAA